LAILPNKSKLFHFQLDDFQDGWKKRGYLEPRCVDFGNFKICCVGDSDLWRHFVSNAKNIYLLLFIEEKIKLKVFKVNFIWKGNKKLDANMICINNFFFKRP
jgi:hypothetical protein